MINGGASAGAGGGLAAFYSQDDPSSNPAGVYL